MEFCNECGSKTDPDWVFCRSCGSSLDVDDKAAASGRRSSAGPKVELISRGWDVVEVEAVDLPADPLIDEDAVEPVPPGAIEVSIDDVTIIDAPATIETGQEEEEEPQQQEEGPSEQAAPPEVAVKPADAEPRDRWDHLRPHGQMPELSDPTQIPAQVAQIAVLLTALAALVAAVLYLLFNIQLDRFGEGEVTDRAVTDVQGVAEASLLVLAGLAGLALIGLLWWMVKALPLQGFRPGAAGIVALPALGGGAALVAIYAFRDNASVSDALTANSLVVLGLGLVMMGCLAVVRMLAHIELKARR